MPRLRLDAPTVRFLERHETIAFTFGGREHRELGDAILIHAPDDPDPFFNHAAALDWPSAAGAFDRRLGELITLFATLDRRPSVWTAIAHRRPGDIQERLLANGFRAMTDAHVMFAVRPVAAVEPGAGVSVERWAGGPGVALPPALLDEVAGVLAGAFGYEDAAARAASAADTSRFLRSSSCHLVLVREEGRVVAAGKRSTFDGASYLSSIGTRPGAAGRGYGTLVTDALVADSRAAGARHVYLAVRVTNDRAVELYRRRGFEPYGEPAGELVLG
ncbi:MAG: Acetyltransferase family [Chloroflexota bacterium]